MNCPLDVVVIEDGVCGDVVGQPVGVAEAGRDDSGYAGEEAESECGHVPQEEPGR